LGDNITKPGNLVKAGRYAQAFGKGILSVLGRVTKKVLVRRDPHEKS